MIKLVVLCALCMMIFLSHSSASIPSSVNVPKATLPPQGLTVEQSIEVLKECAASYGRNPSSIDVQRQKEAFQTLIMDIKHYQEHALALAHVERHVFKLAESFVYHYMAESHPPTFDHGKLQYYFQRATAPELSAIDSFLGDELSHYLTFNTAQKKRVFMTLFYRFVDGEKKRHKMNVLGDMLKGSSIEKLSYLLKDALEVLVYFSKNNRDRLRSLHDSYQKYAILFTQTIFDLLLRSVKWKRNLENQDKRAFEDVMGDLYRILRDKTVSNTIIPPCQYYVQQLFQSVMNPQDKASILFGASIKDFYKILLPKKKSEKDNDILPTFKAFLSPKIISWEGPYNEGISKSLPDVDAGSGQRIFYEGQPLMVEVKGKTYPIGYTIYYPKDIEHIQAIKVDVYGGLTKNDRLQKAYRPTLLSGVDAYCAHHNIMKITLNLPDLLENEVFQKQMTEDFMNILQEGIHHFWESFTKNPGMLHPDLDSLKDQKIPMYLHGASFGGLTTLLQAQHYPGTWTGYIVHDGGILPQKIGQWDLNNRGNDRFLSSDPAQLNDPLLILGNAHDNNVNMRNWTSFYKKAQKAGKSHLIHSWFNYGGIHLNNNDIVNTGHFHPDHVEELQTYASVLVDFMKRKPTKAIRHGPLSAWINVTGLMKSYENDVSATPEKLFLAEAYHQEYEENTPLTDDALKRIFFTFSMLASSDLQHIIVSAEDDHLKRGLSRDYEAWLSFAHQFFSFLPEDMKVWEEHPNVSKSLLASYKNILLDIQKEWKNSSDPKEKLGYFRAMRTFFMENMDVIQKDIETYAQDPQNMTAFYKAKEKWEDFKAKEKDIFQKVKALFGPKGVVLDEQKEKREIRKKNDGLLLQEPVHGEEKSAHALVP